MTSDTVWLKCFPDPSVASHTALREQGKLRLQITIAENHTAWRLAGTGTKVGGCHGHALLGLWGGGAVALAASHTIVSSGFLLPCIVKSFSKVLRAVFSIKTVSEA